MIVRPTASGRAWLPAEVTRPRLLVPLLLGAVALTLPIALALTLRSTPSGGSETAPATPAPPPRPAVVGSTARAVTLAGQLAGMAAGVAVSDRGSSVEAKATVIDRSGALAGGLRVSLALASSAGTAASAGLPCGRGCYVAALRKHGRPQAIVVKIAGMAGSVRLALPAAWPPVPADAMLARAAAVFRALRSVVDDEVLSSGPGQTVRSRFLEEASDRMSYAIENGPAAVVIGDTRWDRDGPAAPWRKTTGTTVLRMPALAWTGAARDATLLGTGRVGGRAVWRVSFTNRPFDLPIWYTVAIDRETYRILELEMVTADHFMHDRYSGFDRPLRIVPPAGG